MPDLILISTGSEVHLALGASEQLEAEGIFVRVVSMPCWKLFEEQPKEYREAVLPPVVSRRISIEAGSSLGWHKWTGSEGIVMGIDRYGESAPYQKVYEHLGLTVETIVDNGRKLMKRLSLET